MLPLQKSDNRRLPCCNPNQSPNQNRTPERKTTSRSRVIAGGRMHHFLRQSHVRAIARTSEADDSSVGWPLQASESYVQTGRHSRSRSAKSQKKNEKKGQRTFALTRLVIEDPLLFVHLMLASIAAELGFQRAKACLRFRQCCLGSLSRLGLGLQIADLFSAVRIPTHRPFVFQPQRQSHRL